MAFVLAGALVALARSALAADPHPPQIAVSFLNEPGPLVQDGATKIVYEMALTNFVDSRYVIDKVEARAGETTATFDAAALPP